MRKILDTTQLIDWVQRAVPNISAGVSGCGYLCRDSQFFNVLWVEKDNTLHLFEVPFQANFVYAVDGKFYFLFSIKEKPGWARTYDRKAVQVCRLEENHQEFLRKQSINSQQILIMQSYLYNQIYIKAWKGTLTGIVQMDDEIDRLRKETLYVLPLSDTDTLYVKESTSQVLIHPE